MGRCVILLLPIVGMLPLIAHPTALEATTVSGTVVMGLGPPIFALLFCDGYRPLTFHLPFWWCALPTSVPRQVQRLAVRDSDIVMLAAFASLHLRCKQVSAHRASMRALLTASLGPRGSSHNFTVYLCLITAGLDSDHSYLEV